MRLIVLVTLLLVNKLSMGPQISACFLLNLDSALTQIDEPETEDHISQENKTRIKVAVPVGNGCPVTAPWPCQQYSFCLSFAFVCDGEIDCPDGYDENPRLCVAKNRPALTLLESFLNKYQDWLVPKYLGDGDIKTIAYNLAISQSLEDYRKNMQLTDEQFRHLRLLLDELLKGRQMGLLLLGMPLQSSPEVYTVLRPIAKGLLDPSATLSL
ncbi:hypothetical protein Aperf_G00000050393 [Anoplocephala perfoliata]